MDLTRMPIDTNGYFSLEGLVAHVEMQTDTSVSFSLGRFTNRPSDIPPESADWFDDSSSDSFYEEIGWIDLHYPCKGAIKALIRVNAPIELHSTDRIENIVRTLFEMLYIDAHETYIAEYFSIGQRLQILQPRDKSGTPRMFYS